MSRDFRCRRRPLLERLENRLALSLATSADTLGLTLPANAIGLSLGTVARPGARGATSVTIAPGNITVGRSSTEFALFVQPTDGSAIAPLGSSA